MIRVSRYLTLPAVFALCWWLVQFMAPDYLPKLHRPWGLVLFATALVIAACAATAIGWHELNERIPGPWS